MSQAGRSMDRMRRPMVPGWWVGFGVLSLLALSAIYPFVFVALTAFKTEADYASDPVGLPSPPTLAFLERALEVGRIGDYTLNSLLVVGAAVLAFGSELSGVAESMLRQDAEGRITVHLVLEPDTTRTFEELSDAYAKRFAAEIDPTVQLRFERAQRLELGPGGKGRVVESAYRPQRD